MVTTSFGLNIMPILIEKHCRLRRTDEDGTRLLVMRYWPRGVSREHVDLWMKHLGPSPELLNWCLGKPTSNGHVSIPAGSDWMTIYRDEMAKQTDVIKELYERHKAGETITLLCSCHDKAECHRTILRDMILECEGD